MCRNTLKHPDRLKTNVGLGLSALIYSTICTWAFVMGDFIAFAVLAMIVIVIVGATLGRV
jgi:hypothetical protein